VKLPRILVLIGSGETAAQMTRGHRMLVGRITGEQGRPADVRAAVIDTPYRFQENAAALGENLVDYFTRRIGMSTQLASIGPGQDVVERAAALAIIRDAQYVFSGPGSPSYALRHWGDTELGDILVEKLAGGGVVVFASAAALTAGRLTVPVYEIYKAGADPYWLTGLDLLGPVGISAAVLPHWDNREGSGHDTRYCFLGERRLRMLEERMPDQTIVLGIDEHTALMLDFDAERAFVHGRGGVTIRERGTDVVFGSGQDFAIDELRRSATTTPSPEPADASSGDPAQAQLARRLVELQQLASSQRRASSLAGPLVETLLELRRDARAAGDYRTADAIRARLLALGIEVADAPDGSSTFRLPS
jgi:cyanophycinase-like exopeptidase